MSLRDESVDIFIYAHEESPALAVCRDAFRRLTNGPHTLHVVCEPGTAYQNFNRGLDRCKNRFVVSAHADVQVLLSDWRNVLLDEFDADPKLGMVGPVQINSRDALKRWAANPTTTLREHFPWERLDSWTINGCLQMFDREKIGAMRMEELMPGNLDGAEVDWCWKIVSKGLKLRTTRHAIVFHEDVGDANVLFQKHGYRSPQEESFRYLQVAWWLRGKWPKMFEGLDTSKIASPDLVVDGLPVWPKTWM